MSKEHRKHPRLPLHWKISLHMESTDGEHIFEGRTHELSQEGASILTDHNVFTHQTIRLRLVIPPESDRSPPLVVEAEARMIYTVYSTSHYCFRSGLHFCRIPSAAKQALENALRLRDPEFA